MKRSSFVLSALTLLVAASVALGATTATHAKVASTKAHTPAVLVDLNSASQAELVALPGVGETIAAKIIEGRPWTAKSQLVAKGVVTKAAFAKFSHQVIAKQSMDAVKK